MYEDDDELDWTALTNHELAELALGPDLWLNVPALSELGDRSPEAARPVAMKALQRQDTLLAAMALRVLAESDMDAALEYMRRTVSYAPLNLLDAMVDVLAVEHPIDPKREPELLSTLIDRLWPPEGSREYNLADLLFRQYPSIRPKSAPSEE
jgi:hypothetical protein